MSEPYLGEIKILSFGFPPRGWAACNGQLLPINQNQALYSILGTTYGGDGITTFALPNLQSRMPIHTGNGFNVGKRALGSGGYRILRYSADHHDEPQRGFQRGVQPTPREPGALPGPQLRRRPSGHLSQPTLKRELTVTDPFLAEIRMFCGNFAPTGWALCSGQLMPISQNTALFSLLGTNYGGDGRVTFGLPDLRGSAPLQQGQGPGLSQRVLGEVGGSQTVTQLSSEMPTHTHTAQAINAAGNTNDPGGATWAMAYSGRAPDRIYSTGQAPKVSMDPRTSSITGGSQPHNNMPPYLCVSFIIALQGIFPQRP